MHNAYFSLVIIAREYFISGVLRVGMHCEFVVSQLAVESAN